MDISQDISDCIIDHLVLDTAGTQLAVPVPKLHQDHELVFQYIYNENYFQPLYLYLKMICMLQNFILYLCWRVSAQKAHEWRWDTPRLEVVRQIHKEVCDVW